MDAAGANIAHDPAASSRGGFGLPPSAMTSRRRIVLLAAALVAAVLAGVGSVRWDLPLDPVRQRLEQALRRDTGYRVVSLGGAAFTAFPWPMLQISGLELAKPGASAETASVPLLKARLNLFSWLTNDPRITALSLFEPRINLFSAESMEETEAVATVITNYLRQDRRPGLSSLRVQSGQVMLDGARWLSDLSLSVSNTAGDDLRLDATGSYRGQGLELRSVVSSAAVRSGRPIEWRLTVGDFAASFKGVLTAPPALDAEGRIMIVLGAGALRSRPFSLSRDAAALLDGLAIAGTGRVALPQMQLRDAIVQHGRHALRGAVDLTASTTAPRVLATLHAETLDLSALIARLAADSAEPAWLLTPIGAAWLNAGRADIRISARRIELGSARLEDAAVSAKVGGGRLEMSISESRLAGGNAKGRLAVAAAGGQLELRASGQLDQVDIGDVLRASGASPVTGLLSGQWSLESAGDTPAGLLRNAAGKGNVAIRNGEAAGLDAERFLRRTEATTAPLPDGRSRFQQADAVWRMDGGVIALTEARVRSPLWEARVAGGYALPTRQLDILARLSLHGPDPQREERAIRLRGPLGAVQATPEGATPPRRS
jgi:AsmA protein